MQDDDNNSKKPAVYRRDLSWKPGPKAPDDRFDIKAPQFESTNNRGFKLILAQMP
jgi:hypothetical protein